MITSHPALVSRFISGMLVLSACSSSGHEVSSEGPAVNTSLAITPGSSATIVKLSARVNAINDLLFEAIPNATCFFQWVGIEPGSNPDAFDVQSGEDGVVAFQLRSAKASVTTANVNCQGEDGSKAAYQLAIDASGDAPAATMLADRVRQKAGQTRPALATNLASTMADQQLLAAHYPPRPDRIKSPDSYGQWLERVSHPATLWTSHPVRSSRRHYINRQAPNWAGVTTAQPSTQKFEMVEGQWVVPNVLQNLNQVGNPGFYADSYVWVGMSNSSNASYLYQAGTEHSVHCFQIDQQSMCTAAYKGVYEPNIYPYDFNIPGWVVPGDTFYVSLWAGDANGNAVYGGGYLWWYLLNNHNGQYSYTSGSDQITPNTYSNFNNAHWIVERPVNTYANGSNYLPHLADVGSLVFSNANASVTSGVWRSYRLPAYDTYEMNDGARLAYTSSTSSSTSLTVQWTAYGTEDPH